MATIRIAISNPEPETTPANRAVVAAIERSAKARLEAVQRAIETRRLQKSARSR
jgi:hypothetical protein